MHAWLQKPYGHLPRWAQNLAISAFGITYRRHRLGGEFWNDVRGFRDRDRWSRDRMREYVEHETRRILVDAFSGIRYYRDKWSSLGITAENLARFTLDDLRRLPTLPKDDLRRDPDALVHQVRAKHTKQYRNPSSGSTGKPITAIWTSEARRKFIAGREVRSFGWAGTSVLEPRSMIGGRPVVPRFDSPPPYYRFNYVERQVYFSAYHVSAANAHYYVEGFNRYKPLVMTGYAHCYYFLARAMLDQGLRLEYRPRALILSSEKLTADMKSVVEEAFRARPYEEYGSVENCVLVTECENGRLHASPDFGVLEVLDEDGCPAAPGQVGRVVCTGLLNDLQPLIRYEIGDLATWSSQSCPCGRDNLPIVEAIEGRVEDIVVGPDGRELVRFHGLFIDLPGLVEAQVIQERIDHLVVRVVATDGFTPGNEQKIRDRARQRLGDISVQVQCVPEIPRSSRGKFRAVISRISQEQKDVARRRLIR